jgi:hypothetical protein
VRRYGGERSGALGNSVPGAGVPRYAGEEVEEEEPGARLTPKGARNAPWEYEDTVVDAAASRAVFDELLQLTFATRSPPHQLVAFGSCKLLEWQPQQLIEELSDVPLHALVMHLQRSTWRSRN